MKASLVAKNGICRVPFVAMCLSLLWSGLVYGSDTACARYAQESLRQNQENQQMGAGFRPPVWSANYEAHFSWCLRGANGQTTPGHLQRREAMLQQHALRGPEACARYARESVRQQRENEQLGAGFRPPVWSANYEAHLSWCTHGANARTTPGHLGERARALQAFVLSHPSSTLQQQPGAQTSGQSAPAQSAPAQSAIAPSRALVIDKASVALSTGRILVPFLMYHIERRLRGVRVESGVDVAMEPLVNGSAARRDVYASVLARYKAIPPARKRELFDPLVLQQTTDYRRPVALVGIRQALVDSVSASADPLLAALQRSTSAPPAPSRLRAWRASGKNIDTQVFSYRIKLEWRWDHTRAPSGFAIYRRKPGDSSFGLLTTVAGHLRNHLDQGLPAPAGLDDGYCYEVRAFYTPLVTAAGAANRIESPGSAPACTAYHPSAVIKDSDSDGIGDPWDWCPHDGYAPEVPRVSGCPDGDRDGLADFIQDPSIPAHHRDACPPGAPAQDGYTNRGAHWAHLRSFDPLPGCPIKYNLRFLGLEVTNGPVDCTNPNNVGGTRDCDKTIGLGNESNQVNEVINGRKLPPGQEPYMVFALTNGISIKGMDESWTKRWCCGEGVQVGTHRVSQVPTSAPATGAEPDNDPSGAEDPIVEQDIRAQGYIILPETFNDSVVIDPFGMTLTATLFERDFDIKYTPKKNAEDIGALVQGTLGIVGQVMQCTASGSLTSKQCEKKLSGKVLDLVKSGVVTVLTAGFADVIANVFGGDSKPADVIAKDTDDVFGIASIGFTPARAAAVTQQRGAYGFFIEYPVRVGNSVTYHTAYSGSLQPPPPPGSPARVLASMGARAKFCLVRKGVPPALVRQSCVPLQHEFRPR